MARALLLALLLAMAATLAEPSTKTECGVVQTAFGMCVPYLMGWDHSLSSQCCMGVHSVKELSVTLRAQRGICKCLEKMIAKIGRISRRRVTKLQAGCRIRGSFIPTGNRFGCRN